MSTINFDKRNKVARLGLARFKKLLNELDQTLDKLYEAHEALGAEEYFVGSNSLKEIQKARQHIINAIQAIAASIDEENKAVDQTGKKQNGH